MTTNEELEALYGQKASHSEYAIGATIRYRCNSSEIATGTIIWIVAPEQVRMRDGRLKDAPLSYVVEAQEGGLPDVIYQSHIVE